MDVGVFTVAWAESFSPVHGPFKTPKYPQNSCNILEIYWQICMREKNFKSPIDHDYKKKWRLWREWSMKNYEEKSFGLVAKHVIHHSWSIKNYLVFMARRLSFLRQ